MDELSHWEKGFGELLRLLSEAYATLLAVLLVAMGKVLMQETSRLNLSNSWNGLFGKG